MESLMVNFMGEVSSKGLIYVIPAIWVIGLVLKGIPKFPNWLIPICSLILGALGACLTLGLSVYSVSIGLLIGASASGLYDVVSNGVKGVTLNSFNTKDGGQ